MAPVEKKEAPRKAAEKKPEKAKAPAPAPGKADRFRLPLKVTAGYSSFTIDGEGELDLDAVKAKVFEANRMFAPKITKVEAAADGAKVVFKSLPKSQAKLTKPYTIVLNGFEVPLEPDSQESLLGFEDGEDDEDNAEGGQLVADAAAAAWENQYPEFKGSSYLVDDEKCIVVPVMKQTLSNNLELPFTVKVFGGESFEVTDRDVKAVDGKVIAANVGPFVTARLGIKSGLCVTPNGIYAVPDTDSANAANANTVKKEEIKIPVTVNLRIFGVSVPIPAGAFGGKKEVTEKELLSWVASPTGGAFPEFAPSRDASIVYDKKSNLAYPIMKAARKGAGEIARSEGEAEALLAEENCFFI